MTFAVHPYRSCDRADCASVFFRSVREGTSEFYNEKQRMAWAPSEMPISGTPDKLLDQWCWVARGDDRIVGFFSMQPDGHLDMAFVLPEVQGRGVADLLYDALLSRADSEGLAKLTVKASHLARRFFKKHGWQVEFAEEFAAHGEIYERFHMSFSLKALAQ